MKTWTFTNGLQVLATAAVLVSLSPLASIAFPGPADAASPATGRDVDPEFLEYLGTFEVEGALDPLALELLETDQKKREEKPVKKKRWFRAEEKNREKDAGNE